MKIMLVGKTILCKFKILMAVILKYKLQSEWIERIWIGVECTFFGKG
jgi:hypothetical protein